MSEPNSPTCSRSKASAGKLLQRMGRSERPGGAPPRRGSADGLAGMFALVMLLALTSAGRAQSLLNELTTTGVEFSERVKIPLPAPALLREPTGDQLDQVKERLAGNAGWERFARDSVVAPVTIQLEYITDESGVRVGHLVHSAFMVHAQLKTLGDKDLMEQIFGKPDTSSDSAGVTWIEMSEQDLLSAGLPPRTGEPPPDQAAITYAKVEFTLLEKIRLSGVLRMERTSGPDGTTIAWLLDPQFSSSEKWRGTWTKISDSQEPHPYIGWGGYVSAIRVGDSPEMLLIESRMVLHELPEWFSASNFVRSKLPLAIQEGARNFRRRLKAR